MGLMTKLFGSGESEKDQATMSSDGNHKIDKAKVLKPTDREVYSPSHPGNFDSIRTAPIVQAPRYFSREEANALGELSRQKQSEAKSSQRAYKHLRSLEESDAAVHKNHYKYAKKVASQELNKLEASNAYAKHLHRLRPGYARLGHEFDQADNQAKEAIANLKQNLKK